MCVEAEGNSVSVRVTFGGTMILSELVVLQSLTRDLVGQVLHVFLHLKSHNERRV